MMIKRIIGLVVTSSLISAGLLFLGTTLMGNFSPALASSLNPLMAGTKVQASSASIPTNEKIPLKSEPSIPVEEPAVPPVVNTATVGPTNSSQPNNGSVASTSEGTVASDITIAQLLTVPSQFIHQVFTITGIATFLGGEKFLLNDGTGQILVEVDNDLVKYNLMNGQSITVTGEFDDSSNQNGFELDASSLVDGNGTTIVHDDIYDDDCNDGLGDDCTDDCTDECTDDCSDDDLDDDGSDDSSDDDLDGDSSDDESNGDESDD
jgi:uncharacterized protein YdeI (BOF family)